MGWYLIQQAGDLTFVRRLRALFAAWHAGKIPKETLVASIREWRNHVRYGNTVGLQKTILKDVPVEISSHLICKS